MSLLHEAVEQKKFDSRVLQRNIERGNLRQEDLDQFVKGLPDDAADAMYVSIDSLVDDDSSSR